MCVICPKRGEDDCCLCLVAHILFPQEFPYLSPLLGYLLINSVVEVTALFQTLPLDCRGVSGLVSEKWWKLACKVNSLTTKEQGTSRRIRDDMQSIGTRSRVSQVLFHAEYSLFLVPVRGEAAPPAMIDDDEDDGDCMTGISGVAMPHIGSGLKVSLPIGNTPRPVQLIWCISITRLPTLL